MKSLERGIRLDLLIAVCALLISSLAMAASWLQSRETARQTQVLEEQLSAQVWPYVASSADLEKDTVSLSIRNDGLGPAVLRSLTVSVDGKPLSDFGAVLHTILGRNFMKSHVRGETLGIHMDVRPAGSVLREGDSLSLVSLQSKRLAPKFVEANAIGRIVLNTCYCAIIPHKCWQMNSSTDGSPIPVDVCPARPDDVLHANIIKVVDRL